MRRPLEKNKQRGSILIITLIFLLLLTLIVVNSAQNVMVNTKIQSATQEDDRVFLRAELGIQSVVLAWMQESFVVPDSPIVLSTHSQLITTDACGNKTVAIQSIAHDAFETIELNTEDIFAKVPKEKKCPIIPAHQVLWWDENDPKGNGNEW